MKYRQLGRTDTEVSSLILGAWVFGGTMWGGGVRDEESIATIHAAIDAGITMIDTAEGYGGGHSEEVIGQALKGRRDDMMIATKVWKANLTPEGIETSLSASLERLGTDYVDLYQIHWPNPDLPIEPTMTKLAEVQQEGRVRHLGVSNFSAEQMEEAMRIARFESLQPPYNLFWRYVEDEELPWCEKHDVSVLPYSPLAQGLLAGKFTADHEWNDDDIREKSWLFQGETFQTALRSVDRMREIANDKGCTVIHLALGWLLAQGERVMPIFGARRPSQLEGVLGAVDVELTAEELAELTRLGDNVMETLGTKEIMWGVG